jgi:hypothetical protein
MMKGVMTIILNASYVIAWTLAVAYAIILKRVLATMISEWSNRAGASLPQLPTGARIPPFSLRVLDSPESMTSTELIGHPSILLFLAVRDFQLPAYATLDVAIQVLRHKVSGYLYIVCHGSEADCRSIIEWRRRDIGGESAIPVLVDTNASVAEAFRVESTPRGVEIDGSGRILKYGSPDDPADIAMFNEAIGSRRRARSKSSPLASESADSQAG